MKPQGIDFLRDLVARADEIPEVYSGDKNVCRLISDYIQAVEPDPHWYGGDDRSTIEDIVGFDAVAMTEAEQVIFFTF